MNSLSSKEALQIARGFEECEIKSTAQLLAVLHELGYEHATRLYKIFHTLSVHHLASQLDLMAYGEEIRPKKA